MQISGFLHASDFFFLFFAVCFLSLRRLLYIGEQKRNRKEKINILQSFYVNIPSKGCVFYRKIVGFFPLSFIYLFGRDTPRATGTFLFPFFFPLSHPSPPSTHLMLFWSKSSVTAHYCFFLLICSPRPPQKNPCP